MKLICKPFKGSCAYEWQILCFVFMLYYPHSNQKPYNEKWYFKIWIDSNWVKNFKRSFKRG